MNMRQVSDWLSLTRLFACVMLFYGLQIHTLYAQNSSQSSQLPVRIALPSEWSVAPVEPNDILIPVHSNGRRQMLPLFNGVAYNRQPTSLIRAAEVSLSTIQVPSGWTASFVLDRVLDYLTTTVPLLGLGQTSFSLSSPQKWSGKGLEGWQVDVKGSAAEVNKILLISTSDAVVFVGARFQLEKGASPSEVEKEWELFLSSLQKIDDQEESAEENV